MKSCKLKIIGTNNSTKHLDGKILSGDCGFLIKTGFLKELILDDQKLIFDVKSIELIDSDVFLKGFISDEKKNVGRVVMKYLSKID
mgnify:CR=1 FL=1